MNETFKIFSGQSSYLLYKQIAAKFIRVFTLFALIFTMKGQSMDDYKEDIVGIIGAGLAGLSAAYDLEKSDIPVAIFEAQSILGARVQTIHFSDTEFEELGGKEINDGGEASSIRLLCNELNCPIEDYEHDYVVRTLEEDQLVLNIFDSIDLVKIKEMTQDLNFGSLGDRLNYFLKDQVALRDLIEAWVSGYEGVSTEGISDSRGVSIIDWLIKRMELGKSDNPKRRSVYFKNVGSSFINSLSKKLKTKVKCNKELTSIKKFENKILLEFSDGDKFLVSKLILTVPCSIINKFEMNEQTRCIKEVVDSGCNSKILIPITCNSPWKHLDFQLMELFYRFCPLLFSSHSSMCR